MACMPLRCRRLVVVVVVVVVVVRDGCMMCSLLQFTGRSTRVQVLCALKVLLSELKQHSTFTVKGDDGNVT